MSYGTTSRDLENPAEEDGLLKKKNSIGGGRQLVREEKWSRKGLWREPRLIAGEGECVRGVMAVILLLAGNDCNVDIFLNDLPDGARRTEDDLERVRIMKRFSALQRDAARLSMIDVAICWKR